MGLKNWLLDKKIKKLLKGLESSSLEVQRNSALAILEKKEEFIEELIDSYDQLNAAGRRNLVVVLGKSNDARAVGLLLKLLKDEDALLRDKAVQSLLALGEELVALPLLKFMAGEEDFCYEEALKILEKMDLHNISGEKKIYYYIARGDYNKCIEVGDAAVAPLLASLEKNKDDLEKKRSIVVTLGKLGSNRATPYLVELLSDKDKYMRERIVEALANIEDESAIEHLIPLLQDPNSWVRKSTVKTLEKLGWSPEKKEDEAAYHLAKKNYKKCIEIGEPAVESITNVLSNSEKPEPAVKKELINALGAIGELRSCNILINYLKDDDKLVAEEAVQAIKSLGSAALSFILKELNETKNNNIKISLIKVLGEIKDEQSAVTLLKLLQTEKEDIKPDIILALGNIKCKESVNPLVEIIKSKSSGKQLLESAVITLGKIGDERAIYPLAELMTKGQYMMSKIKNLAASALGEIGDESAIEILIEYTKDKTCYLSAVEALGKIGSPDAADALYQIMIEEGARIERKIAAVKALELIGGEEIQAILYATLEENKDEKFKRAIIKSLNNLGIPITESQPEKYKKRKLKIRR